MWPLLFFGEPFNVVEMQLRAGPHCIGAHQKGGNLKNFQSGYLQQVKGRRWLPWKIWMWLPSRRCLQIGEVPCLCSSFPKIAPKLVPLTFQNGGIVCMYSESAHVCYLQYLMILLLVAPVLLRLMSVSFLLTPLSCLLVFLTGLAHNPTVILVIHSIKNELPSARISWMHRFWSCRVSFWETPLVSHW